MLISVVIPVYNGEKYIAEAIESVLHQPYQNLEIICVNDGSTDKSIEIIQYFGGKYNNIQVIDKKNGGVGSARNAGLDAARGDYVAFLDQDDIWLNIFSEELASSIEKSGCDVVAFSSCVSNQTISRVNIERREDGVVTHPFNSVPMRHHSSYFFKRSFLKDNRIYTDRFNGIDYNYRNEDVRFLIQCYAKARNIQCIAQPLFVYRNNPASVVHTSKGIKVLTSSLDGFCMLTENSNCEEIQSTCRFYTTRYFLELLENLCFETDYEIKAKQYYEHYGIEQLINDGYASEYSKHFFNQWKSEPKVFWREKRKSREKLLIKSKMGCVLILRKFYHLKKYPIRINRLKNHDQNPLSHT